MTFAVWLHADKCQRRNFPFPFRAVRSSHLVPRVALLTVFPWVRPANTICLFPSKGLNTPKSAHTNTHTHPPTHTHTHARTHLPHCEQRKHVDRPQAGRGTQGQGYTLPDYCRKNTITKPFILLYHSHTHKRARKLLSCTDTCAFSLSFSRKTHNNTDRHVIGCIHMLTQQATGTHAHTHTHTDAPSQRSSLFHHKHAHTNIRSHIVLQWRSPHIHPPLCHSLLLRLSHI